MPKNKSNQQKGGKGGNGSQKSKSGGKPGNSNTKQAKNVKVIEAIPKPTEKTELPQRGSKEALDDWTEFDESSCDLPSITSSSNEKPMDTEYRSKDSFENSQTIDHQTEKDLSNSDTAPRRNAESGDIVGPTSSSEQNSKRQAGDRSQNERRDSCWDRSSNDTNNKSFENTKYKSPTEKNRTSSGSYQNSTRDFGNSSHNERRGQRSQDTSCQDSRTDQRPYKGKGNLSSVSPNRNNEVKDTEYRSSGTYQNSTRDFGSASENEIRGHRSQDTYYQDSRTDQRSYEGKGNRSKHSSYRNNELDDKEYTYSGNYQNSGRDFGNSSQNERRGQRSQDSRTDQRSYKENLSSSPNRNNELNDKDYKGFWSHLKASRVIAYIKVQEIDGDLFAMPKDYSLAHCVAEDMSMGSGIAVQFSRDFKRRDELLQQRQKQGGLAILEIEQRFIYYLVTKRQSTGKPTMVTLWNSLQKLKVHVEEHKVTKLAIPRIGCGLDRLEWSEVKAMIEYTFRNTDIEIKVCNFQQPEYGASSAPVRSFSCKVQNVEYPLVQIEAYTAIVYFGSEDGFVTEEIKSLDTKFKILQDYKTAIKKEGDVIRSVRLQNTFILYGFIVKKSKADLFGFTNLQKCVNSFKKMNTKESASSYVGIQAFLDDDHLIIDKIVNILKYSLRDVEIYVCWPGKLGTFMPQPRRDFV